MLSKNRIKHLKSLAQSKFRQKTNSFVAEGDKVVKEVLKTGVFEVESVYALEDWAGQNSSLLKNQSISSTLVDNKEMQQITLLSTASPVYALLKRPKATFDSADLKDKFSILLDGVQDPGNVGTIIRIADWFGIKNVITNYNTADVYHPKVVQSTMGSICHINAHRLDHDQISSMLNQYSSYGLLLDGDPISDASFSEPGIIVMGSEGQGISQSIIDKLTHKLLIPGAVSRGAESLNVSVAASIICHTVFGRA